MGRNDSIPTSRQVVPTALTPKKKGRGGQNIGREENLKSRRNTNRRNQSLIIRAVVASMTAARQAQAITLIRKRRTLPRMTAGRRRPRGKGKNQRNTSINQRRRSTNQSQRKRKANTTRSPKSRTSSTASSPGR